MREILFRGKHVDNGEWLYGHYVHQYGADMIYLPDGVDREYGFDYYHIKPETVGQYTGFTDKNSKKIFEGDIIAFVEEVVTYDHSYPILDFDRGTFRLPEIHNKEKRIGVVKWCDDLRQYRVHFATHHKGHFSKWTDVTRYELIDYRITEKEVTGNIHDNPELLKEE